MDLRNILHESKTEELPKENKEINIHKKPVQLRDIENRSANNRGEKVSENDKVIDELIQNEKKKIYHQSWNKFDRGIKLNRIKHFIQKEEKEKSLKNVQKEKLSLLLISACKNNKLNRMSDINYNIELGEIDSIKILDYNEETGYSLKLTEVKISRSGGKSKSNIERFIKKN